MCCGASERGRERRWPLRITGVFPLLTATLAAGCISMEVPQGFAVLERGALHAELRAVTADDAKLWVREFDDDLDDAGLEFWREALRTDLVRNRGYTLIDEGGIRDANGQEGAAFTFEVTAEGLPQRYLVVIFVFEGVLFLDDTVRTVEFLAPEPVFQRYEEAVREAIGTLDS